MHRIGSAAADLGLLVLVIVCGISLIALAQVVLAVGGDAFFGAPDPARQMSEKEAALASRLDRGGVDVDYVDFEPEQVTVY